MQNSEILDLLKDWCEEKDVDVEHLQTVREILEKHHVNLNAEEFEDVVMTVLRQGNVPILRVFVDCHLDIKTDLYLLRTAVFAKQLECIKLLLDYGADVSKFQTEEAYRSDSEITQILSNHLLKLAGISNTDLPSDD